VNTDEVESKAPLKASAARRDLGLAAAATGLTAVMWLLGWLAPFDRTVGDTLLRLTHREPADAAVAAIVIDDRSVAEIGPLPWPREIMAGIISAAHRSGAIVVAVDLLLTEAGEISGDLALDAALGEGPSLLAAALGPDGSWLLPHPRFGGSDRAAHVHAEVGPDGVARTILTTKQAGSLALPAFSLSAARVLEPEIVIEPGTIFRPNFRPSPERLPKLSVVELLAVPESKKSLAGRLVFVGVTATGSGDRLIVPTSPGPAPSPGVLVHASAAASILRGGLIHRLAPGWGLFGVFLVAVAPQVLRSRAGAVRPLALSLIVVTVVVVAGLALGAGHILAPTATLVIGLILSVVLREAVESGIAQRESGRLLQSLVRHHHPDRDSRVPRSSAARLAALRDLQTAVLRQDAARRTLLDGMHDGVVMWDSAGRTAVVNPAAVKLWGAEPDQTDFDEFEVRDDDTTAAIRHRGGREISVAVFAIGDGGMALLRDVTAERELERKRRDMQRLVSHELKTPLASIAGFGETLQKYELTPDEQHRVASLIRGESLRLGEMVATFLDLERLGSGRLDEPTEIVDLGVLVGRRLEVLSEAARVHDQEIVSDIEDDVRVQASVTLMDRVIDNLVGNALKYSPEGGKINVGVAITGDEAVLTVTDRGAGIPEESLPRLFERFYRVPGVKGAGSGLGLAVAAEVVNWHGGCIEVESNVGRGTTFSVRLPTEE
jgi:signal transduction histidine kinase